MNNNFPIIEFDYRLGHRVAFACNVHTKTNISSLRAYLPTPRATHDTESMFHYRRSGALSCATRMSARTTKATDTFWRTFELRFTCEYKFMNNLRSRHDPQIHQIDVNMHSIARSKPTRLGTRCFRHEDSLERGSRSLPNVFVRAAFRCARESLFAFSWRQRSAFSQRSMHSRAPVQRYSSGNDKM